ncbi:MAG: long-chain fatty aldehyde decarbonylase [Deltaproteobacteria bacterium]|nr:long-chain fatty aldehyde decarbonylase [Deltaproteobacteria bacterium]
MPTPQREVHDLEHDDFLEEVHSFEFWFQAVEGYLSGTVHGHRPDTRDVPPAGGDRDRLISTLCNYCIGETAALEGASGLVAIAPNRLAKVFLSTQVADEGRHLEVLLRRLADLGVTDPESKVEKRSSPSLQLFRRRLLELVASRDREAAIFAQNVILESLEYAVFHTHATNADPVTREVLEGIIKDERRHIGFGENELGRKLARSPHIRARLGQVRSQLDHLVLDMLETTAPEIGVDRHEQERLGRTYRESVERLGFGS